jgi:hypothetical protein
VIERPVDEALAAAGADHGTLQARGELGKRLLGSEHPAELPLVPVDELGVVPQRGLAVLLARDDSP